MTKITHHGFLRPWPSSPWRQTCEGPSFDFVDEILSRQAAVIVAAQKRDMTRRHLRIGWRPCVSGVVLRAGEVPAWGTIEGRIE